MTARDSLARMHAQIANGHYESANTFALAAIAEALVQMVEPEQSEAVSSCGVEGETCRGCSGPGSCPSAPETPRFRTFAAMSVKRLRWWHRKNVWLGHAGWRYHWDGRVWIGEHNNHPDEPIALTRLHNIADYGPYRAIYLNRFGEREVQP